MRLAAGFLVVCLLAGAPARADTPLPDPAQEARAQALGMEIRCVVCENEPVAMSQAEIAVDMRQAIRTRIAAGDTDPQVRDYFASRYGEFVLLRPRFSATTLVLWLTPALLLLLGAAGIFWQIRRKRASGASPELAGEDVAEAMAAVQRHRTGEGR